MKISISNIAWDEADDDRVYSILKKYNIYGLDIAPGRIFDRPLQIRENDGQNFVVHINKWGLTPVGMQSLLFGTDGLEMFGPTKEETVAYLKKMMDYAYKVGITRLVFGSPKNRLIGNLNETKTKKLSQEIFYDLGNYAQNRNMIFCIEPNPTVYGADFVTNTLEGIELVKQVNNKGFRLHMDLGTIIINNEDVEDVIMKGIGLTAHVHLSHPNLEQVIGLKEYHLRFKKALESNGYSGVVSIEMKNSMLKDNIQRIEETIAYISSIYGGDY